MEEKKKKPFYKKAWFIILIVIVGLVVIGKISAKKNDDVIVATDDKATSAPTATATPEANNYGVGSKVEGEGWTITLKSAKTCTKIGDDEYLNSTAAEGKKYLVMFFEVENTSQEDDYFNWLYFKASEDDYSEDFDVFLVNKIDGYDAITGDVGAGKKRLGYLVYEVNQDWKEFEVTYDDGVWTSNKVATFTIIPENTNS